MPVAGPEGQIKASARSQAAPRDRHGMPPSGVLKVRTFQGVPGGPVWLKLKGAKDLKRQLRDFELE